MNISQYLKMPDPIDWEQGMLLSPQHFQQQEMHVDRLTTHKMYVSQPNYYGLIDIDLDTDDIAHGHVSLNRLHAVMPDGQIIDFNKSDGNSKLDIQIAEDAFVDIDKHKGLLVSVGIVNRKIDGSANNGSQKRYGTYEQEDVTDENNADQKANVKKKIIEVSLFASDRIPSRFVSLPLFYLQRRDDKRYQFAKNRRGHYYHPPMLNIQVSRNIFGKDSLYCRLENLASQMRSKAKSLLNTMTVESNDRATINALIGRLPPLEMLLNSAMIHPFQVYTVFVDLLAGYMTMEYTNDFFEPAGYIHDDAAPGFMEHIDVMLTQIENIQLAFESIPFFDIDRGIFELKLPEDQDQQQVIIALIPREGQDPRLLESWLKSAGVATDTTFDNLRKQRLLGANRETLSGQERVALRLPVKGNIFKLSNENYTYDEEEYATLEPSKKLRIQGRKDNAPAAIFLYRPQPYSPSIPLTN